MDAHVAYLEAMDVHLNLVLSLFDNHLTNTVSVGGNGTDNPVQRGTS